METEILRIDRNNIDEAAIRRAGDIIKAGGLVAFPTETVYGLGGDALNPASSRKIYEAKGRPSDNPLIVHIADIGDMDRIVSSDKDLYRIEDVADRTESLTGRFWPGPMTLILNKADTVPAETTGGLDTVAVRLPSDPVARAFIRASGGYVAAPSANLSGRPSTTSAAHVAEDMSGRIDMIIDAGDVDIGLESTIVDLTGDVPMILRPGAVTEAELREVLGTVKADPALTEAGDGIRPKAPGMKYRHYAPKGELIIVKGSAANVTAYINDRVEAAEHDLIRTGIICPNEHVLSYRAKSIKCTGRLGDEETAAHRLYAILREFDSEGVELIYSESYEGEGMGTAIMNRLLKAAGHKVIDADETEKGV